MTIYRALACSLAIYTWMVVLTLAVSSRQTVSFFPKALAFLAFQMLRTFGIEVAVDGGLTQL